MFHSLIHMFKQEFSTKERENELWLEWNSLAWSDMARKHPSATKEKIMGYLLERFDTFRRCLCHFNITDEMHKQRLLFAVATLDECFIKRARPLDTLRKVKKELMWAVSKFGAGREPRLAVAQPASAPLLADSLDEDDEGTALKSSSIPEGEQLISDRYVHRADTTHARRNGNGSSSGTPSSTRASAWMTCFLCHKKGCWSLNHSKEERVAAANKSPLTKAKRSGAFHVSASSSDDQLTDLLEKVEFSASIQPRSEDIQSIANITANLDMDDSAEEAFVHHCENAIFSYSLTGQLPGSIPSSLPTVLFTSTTEDATIPMKSRYSDSSFRGILVDPGCSIISTGGFAQYKAYCAFVGQTSSINASKQASIILGAVRCSSP